jgi:hypothetical protein
MSRPKFTVSIGCLAPPIEEQLEKWSLYIDLSPTERSAIQKDADQVSRLFARGILTEAEKSKAKARIFKAFEKHVKPLKERAND